MSDIPAHAAEAMPPIGKPITAACACPLSYIDSRRCGEAQQSLASGQHVVERAERVHVVAAEPGPFDPPEHIGEVEIAVAGSEMNLVPVAVAIGETDFVNPRPIERIDEPDNALGYEMRVVGRE